MASFSPEPPVSGHVFRMRRKSGERWMAKWRDADGQHQKVLGRAYVGRGRPPEGYLTKVGAQRELDAILATARAGRVPAKRARSELVTLAQAAEEWIEYLEVDRQRRPSTIRDYRRALRTKLLPAFRDGKVPIDWITVAAVESFREQLVYKERLAPATVNKYLVMLHGILKRAQRRHGLAVNVVASVERQPIRRSGDFRVLSPTEVEALGRAAISPQDAAIFRVAAYTGLRLGELLALRWRDADFEKRLVHVRRSYTADEEGMPKSGRVRSVPMIDQVAAVLDGLSRRERFTSDRDLVFCNEAGDFMDGSALRRRFYLARERAGLRRIRFHDLRHSFGTLAVQVFPLTDVKAYMGHADISTTMIYVHHVPQHDAAAKLSAVLEKATGVGPLGVDPPMRPTQLTFDG